MSININTNYSLVSSPIFKNEFLILAFKIQTSIFSSLVQLCLIFQVFNKYFAHDFLYAQTFPSSMLLSPSNFNILTFAITLKPVKAFKAKIKPIDCKNVPNLNVLWSIIWHMCGLGQKLALESFQLWLMVALSDDFPNLRQSIFLLKHKTRKIIKIHKDFEL